MKANRAVWSYWLEMQNEGAGVTQGDEGMPFVQTSQNGCDEDSINWDLFHREDTRLKVVKNNGRERKKPENAWMEDKPLDEDVR